MQENTDPRALAGKRRVVVFFVTAFFILAVDLFSKARLFSDENPFKDFAIAFFSFTLHQNHGISFNIPIPIWLIVTTTVLVLIGTLIVAFRSKSISFTAVLGLGLVFGGALGNLHDRVLFGFVRDWALFFGRSAMNLADISILIGMVLFLSQSGRKKISR